MPADSPDLRYDVFISYARKDASLGASPLDAALRPRFTVWRDTRGIDPAADFTAEIEKAIRASRRVVVCVTPDVERDDSFVRREIAYASYFKKDIVVARFAEVPPPVHVFTHTWIDFHTGWDGAFERLCRRLNGETIASSAPAGPAPTPPADPYRAYVERLLGDVVEALSVSVFSEDTIVLRAVDSPGDVAAPPRLRPRLINYVLKEGAAPAEHTPHEFASLAEAFASAGCDGRVLLLGEPGAGKTTSLLAFARDAAAARLADRSAPLPLFARIAGWDSAAATPLTAWLAAQHLDDLDAAALDTLMRKGRTLLLLDGLDELGGSRPIDPEKPDAGSYDPRERFLTLLPPSGRLILSSRIEEYRQIGLQAKLACAVRLQGLDDAQMAAYLADTPDLLALVEADPDLKTALATPLLLALFRQGFEKAPEEARMLGSLSAGELNERIWNRFIDQRWAFEQARQAEPLPFTADELKARLGQAATAALGDYRRQDTTRILVSDVGGSDGDKLIALAKRLNLLQPAGADSVYRSFVSADPESSYRFLHLRLRAALAFPYALAAIRDPNAAVRRSAAIALGELVDARALQPLIDALGDPYELVRTLAAVALKRFPDDPAARAALADDEAGRIRPRSE